MDDGESADAAELVVSSACATVAKKGQRMWLYIGELDYSVSSDY